MAIDLAKVVTKLVKVAASNSNNSKSILGAIGTALGVVIVLIFMPVIILYSLFSANPDNQSSEEMITERLPVEYISTFERIETNAQDIYDTFISSGYSTLQARQARDVYIIFLAGTTWSSDVVGNMDYAFSDNAGVYEIVDRISERFGVDISPRDLAHILNAERKSYINPDHMTSIETKNNIDLCIWAQDALKGNWGYVWGTYGNILTEESLDDLASRFPNNVGDDVHYPIIQEKWIGHRTVDCAGLIKSYFWYDYESESIIYGSNGFGEGDTEGVYGRATTTGTMDSLPEIPGMGLYHPGHVGIYMGNGMVIEARGTKYGVVSAELSEGSWTNWFYIPGLIYVTEEESTEETTGTEETNIEEEN